MKELGIYPLAPLPRRSEWMMYLKADLNLYIGHKRFFDNKDIPAALDKVVEMLSKEYFYDGRLHVPYKEKFLISRTPYAVRLFSKDGKKKLVIIGFHNPQTREETPVRAQH